MGEAPDAPVVREAGDAGLLLELEARIAPEVNARAVAAAARVRAQALPGVRDVVPTYRSVAVYFDPTVADVEALAGALRAAADAAPGTDAGATVEVPVVYGGEAGPDLDAVAAWAGLQAAEVVARHARPAYRVYMMGFLPGFAYLGTVDQSVAAPRRPTPRVRVPAGSVGIAGAQTGIYPSASPGGWQIVGRTPLRLFDPARDPVSLLASGDRVRFVPVGDAPPTPAATGRVPDGSAAVRHLSVVRPGLFTTVQDLGRWGFQDRGVTVSGALDAGACRRANAAVGNQAGAAVLEVTLQGPELRFDAPARVAVAGADLGPSLDGHAVPRDRAADARAGSTLRFAERRAGARAYVAVDGGVETPVVLGSRSTHARSGLGGLDGRPLRPGDRVPLGAPAGTGRRQPAPPLPAGGARLRVLPGPQLDAFGPGALERLGHDRFHVSAQSDRMGYRLEGARVAGAPGAGTMISDATFPGAVQVPPSGEPILLLADRPTTGGYPQIAVVASADLAVAGQLAPGDWVEFVPCWRHEAVAALREGRDG